MKISILIPFVRKRKIDLLISNIFKSAGVPRDEFEILAIEDKELIGCPKMLSKLLKMASNEILVFLGDDTEPMPGFIFEALKVMHSFDDHWGLVGFQDYNSLQYKPNVNYRVAPHFMLHKNLLKHIDGEIFHTGYKHDGAYELFVRARSIKRYKLSIRSVVKHNHPLLSNSMLDEHYVRVLEKNVAEYDIELFKSRMRSFGLPEFPMCEFPWEDFSLEESGFRFVDNRKNLLPYFFKKENFKFEQRIINGIL